MIDLHTHILPGVDDGARDLDESVEIARAALADGTTVLAATPHVRSDYPTRPERMERLVDELRRELLRRGAPVDLRSGGEVALDALEGMADVELGRFGLGGNPSYLLLEFPYYGWPLELENAVFRLQTRGTTAVLAHPERNPQVQAEPERLRSLVEGGALVQITAASLDGRLGRGPRAASQRLLELELVHLLASDAHSPEIRQVGMSAAAKAVGDRVLARWLTEGVPAAIVAATTLPPRPEARRHRFPFSLRS